MKRYDIDGEIASALLRREALIELAEAFQRAFDRAASGKARWPKSHRERQL